MSRRRRLIELWDASHFAFVEMWQSYGHLFPRSLHVKSRPIKPSPDVVEFAESFGEQPIIFFSAWLSCGHVVQVPAEILILEVGPREPKRRSLVPCYKCWAREGGDAFGTIVMACSFCGVPHESSVPCIRPHLDR